MLLSSIVNNLEFQQIKGSLQVEINAITYDSREVSPGSLFVAITGFQSDGHHYISKAIERGAAAIVIDKDTEVEASVAVLKVEDSRDALARISAAFYHDPTASLNLIGVTGTNGKTSITYFIQSILQLAGRQVGLIGTTGTYINGQAIKNKHTTPESVHLQHLMSTMVDEGITDCVMEVSSHAISLKRTSHLHFNYGIFSNLTPDHLEFHHTMEDYFQTKARLFELTREANIVNADDKYGRMLIEQIKHRPAKLMTYGIDSICDVYADDIRYDAESTRYTVHTPIGSIPIRVNLPGVIYVYNTLAAIAFAVCNEISLETVRAGIDQVTGITGRLETVYQNDDLRVVVDFAHTEDGLEMLLKTLRPYAKSRIILVFGVYGSEDVHGENKRNAMGKVAGTYSDLAIVTSDNPKNQDPERIIQEIEDGVRQANGRFRSFLDRKEAIHYALEQARSGDIVVIAGKGHETSQVIGQTEIPFNEKEIVQQFMESRQGAVK